MEILYYQIPNCFVLKLDTLFMKTSSACWSKQSHLKVSIFIVDKLKYFDDEDEIK